MSGLAQLKRDVKRVAKDVQWLKRRAPVDANESSGETDTRRRLDELAETLDKIDGITAVRDWMIERGGDNRVHRQLGNLSAKREVLHQNLAMLESRKCVDWHPVWQVLDEIATVLAEIVEAI